MLTQTLFWPAVISGVAGLASSWLGNKQRDKDYERQKEDRLEFFDIRNKYNSPENQMNLLKEAGLNPNLAYGQGFASSGAGQLQSPDLDPGPYREPISTGIGTMMQHQDLTVKNAQEDNLRAQADKLAQESMLTKIRAIGEQIKNVQSEAELEEWLDKDQTEARKQKRIYDSYKSGWDASIAKDKYQIQNLEKQIFKAASGELKKYRIKLPEAEYNLLQQKTQALMNSSKVQGLIAEYYEMLKAAGVAAQFANILIRTLL